MVGAAPPDKDDPTSEEEALEFDGTQTDQLDDTYRFRVVAASESGNGTVGFDDRGQPHWKWITELSPTSTDVSGTFDQLKALENPALKLEDRSKAEPEPEPSRKVGYDPYATGVFQKPKPRR
jgi:hypothetical protein